MTQDLEMKDRSTPSNSVSPPVPSTLQHLKEIATLIETGSYSKEVRRIARAVRLTIALRRKLTGSVITSFLDHVLTPGSESHAKLSAYLPKEDDHEMEVDAATSAIQTSTTKHLLPELEIYCYLLVLLFLIDQKKYNEAKACSSASVAWLKNVNRRTVDVIASRLFFYYSYSHELTGDLAEIRGNLLALHRIATLRHDELGQETLLNLLLRNYLHYNLFDQAEKLRSKAPRFEAHSNQQFCRYLFYLGKIRTIQLEYTDAKESLLQAARKAPVAARGFRIQCNKWAIIVRLLLGEIPERTVFMQKGMEKALRPYFELTNAVRIGDLELFKNIADKFATTFSADGTHNLIVRLRHNVIRTGLRNISISYSRISLVDVAKKLRLDSPNPVADAESIVSKAIRDDIDGLEVLFPYERMYSEQLQYMRELKRALDAHGHCMLEMPTGTGKTVSLLSLVLAYKHAHPTAGKLIYCTRTVPEMSKCVEEIKKLIKYRESHYGDKAQVTAVCLSSRRNMCVHPRVMAHADGEDVDGQCRKMTASWVRARAAKAREDADGDVSMQGEEVRAVETCSFYENYSSRKSDDMVLPPGVYSVDDLKELGVEKGWCPYFLTRYVVTFADVVVYNYQYMLDPKVSQLVSRSFEKESIVVFDEAHNIDNVCIEALSVDLDRRSLDRASRNLTTLSSQVNKLKQADKSRLDAEYRRLVEGLRSSNAVVAPTYTDPATNQQIDTNNDILIANPVLPDDVLDEAIPGNIRRAEHFVAFMRRLIEYLRQRIRVRQVESETPQAFLHHLHQAISMEIKPMKFCYTRLNSLLRTLEVTNLEEYNSLTDVADFATLVATYAEGFMLIIEPFDSASGVHDPVLQLSCLDASLAIRPVFERFSSVIITSGTLSPIDLYPRLLNFNPVIRESLPMSVYRSSICPLVITRGSDQMPVSTKFDLRDDLSVVRNYGTLLLEMAACTPDGMVCFFPSYLYMEKIIGQWDSLGVLKRVLASKLLFIETKDIVETTLALDNYKKACDCGRGAIFFSVARGKVAEGIDFDRHYGRAVILFGIPFQYTLSNTLRARLEYLRYTHQIREGDFLTFDALRQAAQCAGRVLRSKTDYGLVIFADSRYNRADKRTKLPPWITQFLVDSHLNLSVDMAVFMAKKYLSLMAQPVDEATNVNSILLDADGVARWLGRHPREDEPMQ